jgi:hypothetical protein
VREIHESPVKNDPVRVADFGNGLNHIVKLSFTADLSRSRDRSGVLVLLSAICPPS